MTDPASAPARELADGLLQSPARIAAKYFYDAHGSTLFEEITRLPEYYPTRTERAILQEHAAAIAAKVSPGGTVVELGAGNCDKARALCALIRPTRFVAIDISATFLRQAVADLQRDHPEIEVRGVVGDLTREIAIPADIPGARRLVFYPGSSIGNFDPPQALALLQRARALIDADGGLLIGIDLVKDVDVLEAAYDDAAGVTAAFNRNVLRHVNRLLGSNFVPDAWEHRAFFNRAASRIEMHLEAGADTRVAWNGGGRDFAAGERIHTENSYKYEVDAFRSTLAAAGFSRADCWTDPRRWFAMVLAQP